MNFSFDLDKNGYLKKRESFDLEYKQNFQLGDNLLKYLKTLAGMANNRGGQIVFGIKDSRDTCKLPWHNVGTSETQIFMRGVVDVVFYDDSGKETERFHIDPAHGTYGVQVPAGQWHTLEVIEPAVLFEAKDGKYNPLSDKDFLEK